MGIDPFLHFVADNMDHNTDTVDTLNTFYDMSNIACVKNKVIKRMTIESSEQQNLKQNSSIFLVTSNHKRCLKISIAMLPLTIQMFFTICGNMCGLLHLWNPCGVFLWKHLMMIIVQGRLQYILSQWLICHAENFLVSTWSYRLYQTWLKNMAMTLYWHLTSHCDGKE